MFIKDFSQTHYIVLTVIASRCRREAKFFSEAAETPGTILNKETVAQLVKEFAELAEFFETAREVRKEEQL